MPISQTITAIPRAGRRGVDARTPFVINQEAFQGALETVTVPELNNFATQANLLETNVNAKEASAVLAEASAVAAANFKGTWTNQTTAIGESWLYNGVIYGVLIAGNTSPIASPSNWFALSLAKQINNATSKTTPVDADEFGIWDSISGLLNKVTWANIKATISSHLASNGQLGRKNYLINGNFKINERAYVSGAATVGANQYIFDRWYIPTTGQSATFTTTNGIVTVTAPASGIVQKVENISNNGGAMTVSYVGTATLTVAESTDNITYTAITLTGKTFTTTAGNYIKITLASGTVSLVKIEDGSVATDGWNPYDGELGGEVQACQRYLPIEYGYMLGQAVSTTLAYFLCVFKVRPRVVPTGVSTTVAGVITNASAGALTITGLTFSDSTLSAGRVSITVASGLVAGDVSTAVPTNKLLFTGCEL